MSSFQLAHSKFIAPDYAVLLNITNDHLDWHGSNEKIILILNLKFLKTKKKAISLL